ncbi:MAG: addiction module antidote protein, HigA family [Caldilinea sp. CFX5]|nr:addiction module antidote protein, HigA family [Caldilinea sp. CFX5]
MNELVPAYTPPPGEILAIELAARGWSQRQFAAIIGRPPQVINEILRAKKQITPETALRIAAALNTSPELWINLEADYRLSLARQAISPQLLTEIAERSSEAILALA